MNSSNTIQSCYHCGNEVTDQSNGLADKLFCCNGCKMVYEILEENNLCNYYELNAEPGIIQNKNTRVDKYAFLDDLEIQKKLIQFSNSAHSHITLYLPQIHCSSCLWLLENIHKVNAGIVSSRFNFTKKEVFIVFDNANKFHFSNQILSNGT